MTLVEKERKIVLDYPKLRDYLKEHPDHSSRVEKNLRRIRADFSHRVIGKVERFLDISLNILYDGITTTLPGDMDFKEECKDKHIILVPNHQSHADYLALNYMIYKHYKISTYIAGGENLNIFPLGRIFRGCGCFFIRRTFARDHLYRLTLEAYIYFLLESGHPIEFFFEGGRSRTGRLLPPRYGLYQMILEAYEMLESKKPLCFVPVSIVHEYVSEQKTLTRELGGAKKARENIRQLVKLFKLVTYQFGNMHIKLGRPVSPPKSESLREVSQKLAFKCFHVVGSNMSLTPSSLLALILLDEPTGALKWNDILQRSKCIIDHCKHFSIPFVSSLDMDKYERSLGRSLDIMIGNGKINIIGKKSQGHVFYSIRNDTRIELLYFKNTILHHFLVPWVVNLSWIGLFNGSVKTVENLKDLFLTQLDRLKHEFYLPSKDEFLNLSLRIFSHAVGRKIESLDECMNFSHKDIFAVASKVGIFSRVCSYITEGHYLSAKALIKCQDKIISREKFFKKVNKIHSMEISFNKILHYPESCIRPVLENGLKYFISRKIIQREMGSYRIVDKKALTSLLENYEMDLQDRLSFNIQGYA